MEVAPRMEDGFPPSGAEVIELGPINKTIHQIDEKISLSDLDLLTDIYYQVLIETQAALKN